MSLSLSLVSRCPLVPKLHCLVLVPHLSVALPSLLVLVTKMLLSLKRSRLLVCTFLVYNTQYLLSLSLSLSLSLCSTRMTIIFLHCPKEVVTKQMSESLSLSLSLSLNQSINQSTYYLMIMIIYVQISCCDLQVV
jgi:hypothetical protein